MSEVTTRKRLTAMEYAMMLVANGKLRAWEAIDYAYAIERFLATGVPPRDIAKLAKASKVH